MLDYPLHFPGPNSTVAWGDPNTSLAVVIVALAVLLFTCCAAAALFLVSCCGSRRRDAVGEMGDSRWLPGIGLIDYVPVSDRSSVRVSLILSESSHSSQLQEDLYTSNEALIPVHLTSPSPVATAPSAFVNSCCTKRNLPAQKIGSMTKTATLPGCRLPHHARQRPRSLPTSPTKSLISFVMLSQETTYPVLVSLKCEHVSKHRQSPGSTASLSRSASLSLPSIFSLAVTTAHLTPTPASTKVSPLSPPSLSPPSLSPPSLSPSSQPSAPPLNVAAATLVT